MRGILWHVARKLDGILDGILICEFRRIRTKKIKESMYIPWYSYLSSGFYGRSLVLSTKVVFRYTTPKKDETK